MKSNHPHWEHFEHQADIGVRGFGSSIAEAFEQIAVATTAVITDPAKIKHNTILEIECQEIDQELLLVDWLNALVYEMTTRKMLFSRFEVTIQNGVLKARISGEIVDIFRHEPAVEIKGATYTELEVRKSEYGNWCAQCVVDV